MLIGEYRHRIDAKKRLSLPAKMRKEMGDRIVVTRGLDRCLFVYPVDGWKAIAEKLSALSVGSSETRQFVRLLLAGATDIDVDALGRMLLPEHLRAYANLATEVVIAGVYTRAEIWDKESWNAYQRMGETRADELAEKLGASGLY